jgi:hypothetical protein
MHGFVCNKILFVLGIGTRLTQMTIDAAREHNCQAVYAEVYILK